MPAQNTASSEATLTIKSRGLCGAAGVTTSFPPQNRGKITYACAALALVWNRTCVPTFERLQGGFSKGNGAVSRYGKALVTPLGISSVDLDRLSERCLVVELVVVEPHACPNLGLPLPHF